MSNRRNHRRSASLKNRRNNYVPLMSWGCGRYCTVCFPKDRQAKIIARDERRHRTHAERLEAVEHQEGLKAAETALETFQDDCGPDCRYCWGRSLTADLEKASEDRYANEAERALGDWMAASVDTLIEVKIRERWLKDFEEAGRALRDWEGFDFMNES